MKVGVLKDIKVGEYRVIATPAEVSMLVGDGNEVYVQKGAGEGSGFPDEAYVKEGAKLVDTKEEIYATCDFVAKVKEFEPCEYKLHIRRRYRHFSTASVLHLPQKIPTVTVHRTARQLVRRVHFLVWNPCSPSTAARANSSTVSAVLRALRRWSLEAAW